MYWHVLASTSASLVFSPFVFGWKSQATQEEK